jgi:histidine ammonia-lyase
MDGHHQTPTEPLPLDGQPLTIAALDAVFDRPISVDISQSVVKRIEASRAIVERLAAGDAPVYGINTGFGHLCRKRVDRADLDTLQHNLIRSHAVGVGDPVPDAIVRWMLLFKIHALCQGYSGVRVETVRFLAAMLNQDILPLVPKQGSLGASGDLAPLAHMVLPMVGEGRVRCGGDLRPSVEVLRERNIASVHLGAKEGLALINGTQFMSAYAAAILVRAQSAVRQADIIASMSLDGLRGSMKPFDERLHAIRPHAGAIDTAANFRNLMRGSEVLESHADCHKVQDPYSLRCIPQVHGAIRDTIRHALQTVETEINSVTDNPIIFDDGSAVSGGNFHGEPLAFALDFLAIALAELAGISERRIYLLLSGHDGLPSSLMQDTGLNSGFMLPQYTAAALVSENKILASPASVDSIPTSLGQEDHVSMGATSATKAWRIMNNVETVLAIEQMCAAQALDYRAPLQPGAGPRVAHDLIRKHIPHTEEDRLFGEDIHTSLALLRSRSVLRAVEQETGSLNK